jgi:hypothetical protein
MAGFALSAEETMLYTSHASMSITRTSNRRPFVLIPCKRVVLSMLIALSVMPQPLAGQNPNAGRPEDFTQDVILLAGQGCQFDTSISIEGTIKELNVGDRTIFIGPRARATVTNLEEPSNQVTLDIPGSFHLTELSDGTVVYDVDGRNLLWGGTLPTVTLTIGTFTFALDPSGNEVQALEGHGQTIDVCAMIS